MATMASQTGTIDRQALDRLERRELQLTIVAAVFVFVLASGLAVFMYPLVFVHPVETGNKWTMRVAFFGFCALTLLFIGYLLERQRTVRNLKGQILQELERNIELRVQASADLLQTMPDINHFWDRLTMEFRRAMTMQHSLTLVLVKAKGVASGQADNTSALGDAAKAMSRKLRPTDSIYRLAPELFALVLPETDTLSAKRIAVRLQEELQTVRAKHGGTFDTSVHNYPEHVQSSHELEDIVKSMLAAKEEYAAPVPVPVKA